MMIFTPFGKIADKVLLQCDFSDGTTSGDFYEDGVYVCSHPRGTFITKPGIYHVVRVAREG